MGMKINKLFFVVILLTTWLPCGMMAQDNSKVIDLDAEFVGKSADGKKIRVQQIRNTLLLNDAETGEEISRYLGRAIICSNFKRLLAIENDTVSCIINAETGEKISMLSERVDWVEAEFSSDCTKLLTFSEDVLRPSDGQSNCTIRIWDTATGEKISEFSCNSNWYYPFVFSPDGEKIITSSGDYSVQLWDADTGKKTVVCSHEQRISTDRKSTRLNSSH